MMRAAIYTTAGPLYEGEARSVAATGREGAFEVLEGHAPYIVELVTGTLRLSTPEGEKSFSMEGGFLWVSPEGEVRVLLQG